MAYGSMLVSRIRFFGLATGLVMVSGFCEAAEDNPANTHTTLCRSCLAEPQFAVASLDSAPDRAPAMGRMLVYPVYVINPHSLESRFFEVRVSFDRSEGPDDRGVLSRSAIPGPGDPELNDALVEGVLMGKAFLATWENLHVDVLPYPPESGPGSAVDLIGPEGPATLAARNLAFQLQDHLEARLSVLVQDLSELQKRVFMQLFVPSGPLDSMLSDLKFPDGTSIMAEITAIQINPPLVQVEVLYDSGRMPNGSAIPHSPGHFIGYHYTGPADVGQTLIKLLSRYDVPVPGGQPNCDFACTHNGGDRECTLTCSPD